MDIRIDNSSEVPIRHQLAEQIVFLIATNRLAAGETLPSVREMARRLKIHSLREILLPHEKASMSRSADIIFCDSIANQTIRSPRAIHYHLLSSESVNYAANVMRSYAAKLDP